MTAFLDVLFRGLSLAAQAIAIGGVAFLMLLRASATDAPAVDDLACAGSRKRTSRVLRAAAIAACLVAIAQIISLVVEVIALGDVGTAADFAATLYFRASAARVLACIVLVVAAVRAGRAPTPSRLALAVLAVAAVGLAASAAWTSHAAGRLEWRGVLLGLETLHQLAAAVWIGNLFHLLGVRPWRGGDLRDPTLLRRFSLMMLVTVAVLVAAGTALAMFYVASVPALVGTSYGLMLGTKVVILAALVLLGGLNFLAVRRRTPGLTATRLHRFVEAELGLGITVFLVAASLTSQTVAADLTTDRATPHDIVARTAPQWPTFTSPRLEELPVNDRDAPRTDEDRAWSEYNHHVAGLFVLATGLLAILHGTGRARWARHWPLMFLGLAAFLFVRDDPGAWPIGPIGFWESMQYPEVLQHRTFVAIVIAFALFERAVRAGRVTSPRLRLVFPVLCAIGGALLFTHSHGTVNIKEEFLTEISHAPLALLGLAVGWGRWLELRLPEGQGGLPARISEWSLALVGVLLLLYREH